MPSSQLPEVMTDKRRILDLETGPRPWQAAVIIASLMLACTAIAALVSL